MELGAVGGARNCGDGDIAVTGGWADCFARAIRQADSRADTRRSYARIVGFDACDGRFVRFDFDG
jgi:hypothetical protein